MPLNTLLLPLLGGYVFVSNFNRTKFRARRHKGHRLFFDSAIAGAVLLLIGVILARLLGELWPELRIWWKALAPFTYSGSSTIAFVLGCLLWYPANRWLYPQEQEISRVIEEDNDYLELLLEKALKEYRMISVTTTSGKVYVGDATGNFLPSRERRYLKLIPYVSGYRAEGTKEVVFTTEYSPVYEEMAGGDLSDLNKEDFEIVLPITEVASVNIFDIDAYRDFSRLEDE